MAEAAPAAGRGSIRGLHLYALWSLAVAGPLLDVLGRAGPFFIARQARSVDVVLLLSVSLALAPLVLLGLLAAVTALSPRGGQLLRQAATVALTAMLVAPALSRATGLTGSACVAAGGITGLLLLLGLHHLRPLREVLAWTALSPLLFVAVFVGRPGVSAVLFAEQAQSVDDAVAPDRAVVLLVLDELPLASLLSGPGELDAGLFPHLAELAASSTWYANATSVHESTTGAVPSLLTGRRPSPDRLPILAHHPRNLFTWLGGGPPVHALESVTALCPPALRREGDGAGPSDGERVATLLADAGLVAAHAVLPADLTTGLPSVRDDWGDFWRTFESPRLRAAVLARWIDGVDAPGLHVAHVLLPHLPWFFLPDGRQYASPDAVSDPHEFARWGPWEFESDQALQRHLLQLGHVDALIGRLVHGLKQRGLWDDALVAVVADHGASFEPGQPRREATTDTLSDIARVPLFVKAPGQHTGRKSRRNVESVDLLPLLAEALGRELPWPVDGAGESAPERDSKTLSRQAGDALTMPAEGPVHDPLLARRIGRFGAAPDWSSVFALGRGQGLLGVATRSLPAAPPALGRVTFAGSAPDLMVAPDAGVLPAFVAGQVLPADGEALPPHVALTLDDVVASVVPVADDGVFSAVLDPRALTPGPHRLAALALGPDGRLAPFASTRARLTRRADGSPEFVTATGRRLPLAPDLIVGVVDRAVDLEGAVQLTGWALDRRGPRAPDTVVVLAEGRAVAQTAVDRPRNLSDREAGLDPAVRPGFRLELPVADLPPGEVRVLAVSGDRAAELTWGPEARWLGERLHRLVPGAEPHLLDSSGRRVPLAVPHVRGVLDVAELDDEHLLLLGWAADVEAGREAEELLVLVDGVQVFSGHQWLPRDDLAQSLGDPGLGRAGFRYQLPRAWLPDDPAGRVRIMARSGSGAAELSYAAAAAWLRPSPRVVTAGAPLPLALDPEGGALVGDGGAERLLVSHRLRGAVDLAVTDGAGLRLQGWAAAEPDGPALDQLVLLVDGRARFVGPPWSPRPDVAAELGLAPEAPVGFAFVLPDALLGDAPATGRVAMLACSRGLAQVLPLQGDADWLSAAPRPTGPAARRRGCRDEDAGLRAAGDELLPWREPRPRGQVDLAASRDGRLTVVGWAADPGGAGGGAWQVLVFDGRRLLGRAPVGERRDDVVALHDRDDLRWSGFTVDLPWDGPAADHADLEERLDVIAVSPDGAVTLPFEER